MSNSSLVRLSLCLSAFTLITITPFAGYAWDDTAAPKGDPVSQYARPESERGNGEDEDDDEEVTEDLDRGTSENADLESEGAVPSER